MKDRSKRYTALVVAVLVLGLIVGFAAVDKAQAQVACNRWIEADVIALDQNFFINRLGALNNLGMIYALAQDVFPIDGTGVGPKPCSVAACTEGQVVLRPDKRPQPMALRVSKGDCLQINFRNLLRPNVIDPNQPERQNEQNVTRHASAHVTGLPLVGDIGSDGSWVGANPGETGSLVAPGKSATYKYYAIDENVYMITNMANTTGSQGSGGSLTFGLYGVVIVEPGIPGNAAAAAEYYRGHVTNEDMALAACDLTIIGNVHPSTACLAKDKQKRTDGDQPKINYDAVFPDDCKDGPFEPKDANGTPLGIDGPFCLEGKANRPILAMLQGTKLVHSDIHAVITGPKKNPAGAYKFVANSTYPSTSTNPRQDLPFREAASVFGDEHFNVQSFPFFFDQPVLKHTLNITKDGFVINYGGGGIGPEIVANRLAVGPMWDCPECKAEEFFLTSYAVGDPGMWVDLPANGCVQDINNPIVNGLSAQPARTPYTGAAPNTFPFSCDPRGTLPTTPGPKATVALYPDNPSNVHHSYIRDHFKFRNIHAGPFEHHIFHLHGNQWVFSPKSDNANYADMQQIGPGGAYTMDITNEGSGNRNAYPGDAIYHCHFYPHFAQGMWSSLRIHDVFEEGTRLEPAKDANGVRIAWAQRDAPPATGARAYPDGEVGCVDDAGSVTPVPCGAGTVCIGMCDGSPVPAVVPLPLFPMAPAPAAVAINPADPRRILVTPNAVTQETNPGFPFYIMSANGQPGAVAGHRPPSPPLDIACLQPLNADNTCPDPINNSLDGGLPRHVITGGTAEFVTSRYDINKELVAVAAEQVPEAGTDVEKASFDFQGKRCHNTFTQLGDGTVAPADCIDKVPADRNNQGKPFRGGFTTNGSRPKPGAPHADPCVDNKGNLLVQNFTPEWNKAGCALARTDNPDGANCAGFTLAQPVQFGASIIPAGGVVDEPNIRPYKISNIQIDLVLNKKGWHFPQQRIIALWGDIPGMYAGTTPPAPMVFRLNTLDCAEVWHSNLVPNFYELDDFQVRTPTDIIAQHSHMTKFDMASSDGAANLWNYEDGTMSPGEIVERIRAIKAGSWTGTTAVTALVPKKHPFLEGKVAQYVSGTFEGCTGQTCGSRTTIQRWLADPVLNNQGVDRGIGNVFTHDHFGPSTFQQLGLYATILAEPARATWRHNETAAPLATRVGNPHILANDGGPTSWQAQIIPPANSSSFNNQPFREFYFENSDFQQAYKKTWDGLVDADSFLEAISRPSREGDPLAIYAFVQDCPGPTPAGALPISPCPMAIGGADQGTQVINYRGEPIGARIFNPDPLVLGQAAGVQGDLSFAFGSIRRADPDLNVLMAGFARNTKQCPSCIAKPNCVQGTFDPTTGQCTELCADPPFCTDGVPPFKNPTPAGIGAVLPGPQLTADVGTFDPPTPMMRIYEGDQVKIRMQVGATEESHQFSMHGAKWLMNYADPNSGWRNVQSMGISEQFQFDFPVLGDLLNPTGRAVDYLYSSNMSESGLWDGDWGLMRVYAVNRRDLAPLPNNPMGAAPAVVANRANFVGVCPAIPAQRGRPAQILNLKPFDVTAIMAKDVLPAVPGITNPLGGATGGTLVFNSRPDVVPNNDIPGIGVVSGGTGPLHDPTAILYVRTADIPGLKDGSIKPEPLIIRANPGDCIQVTLRNALPAVVPDLNGITFAYEPVIDKCPNAGCPTAADPVLGVFKATFNANDVHPSENVGLHSQLLMYDMQTSDGVNVGQNVANPQGAVVAARVQTVPPGGVKTFTYYAGDFVTQKLAPQAGNPRVNVIARPIEFGIAGLSPSDKLEQAHKGMVGAAVIEPKGVTCTPDVAVPAQKAQATCTGAQVYREFVSVTTSASNAYFASAPDGKNPNFTAANFPFQPVPGFPTENPLIGVVDDAEDAGLKAINYKSEPYWFRLKMAPGTPLNGPQGQQTFPTLALYSNSQVGNTDPETPIYMAKAGEAIRFYFAEPMGSQRSAVPVMHGHVWQRIPYLQQTDPTLPAGFQVVQSQVIGDNDQSQIVGAQEGYSSAGHWNFIPRVAVDRFGTLPVNAGGPDKVTGDYLWRAQNPQSGYQGFWGLFRVE